MACSVLGTQVALLHHFSLRRVVMLPFLFCSWFLLFLFCLFFVAGVFRCGCWLVFFGTSVERHHTALALRAQEAYYSIGFTYSN